MFVKFGSALVVWWIYFVVFLYVKVLFLLSSCISLFFSFIQKRDTGSSAFSGTSDKSCGTKSVSTPSTPLAESGNHAESRHSHSLPAQSSPLADFVSATREDKEICEDNLLGQDTPLVCSWLLLLFLSAAWEKCHFLCHLNLIILVK